MEDFSQSRGDDDLFDDEIVPIEETHNVEALTTGIESGSQSTSSLAPLTTAARDVAPRLLRGANRGGSTRKAPVKNDLLNSRYAPQPLKEPPASETPTQSAEAEEDRPQEGAGSNEGAQPSTDISQTAPTPSKPAAVRGDRTGTGGIKKPKLTEDELNAKLAAAKERSQNLSAAHARAEADAASFEERERAAQQKRAKDAVNRKVMDNEREKNRARKIAVMGGREWDAEKNEEDFRIPRGGRGRGRGNQVRAMNGSYTNDRRDPAMDDTRQYEWHEDRGRGRGNRGRGRGGRGNHATPGHDKQPRVSAESDFPALPASINTKKVPDDPRPSTSRKESDILSPGDGGTWADQVEMSEAAKI